MVPSGEEWGREVLNELLVDSWGGTHEWDLWRGGVCEPSLLSHGHRGAPWELQFKGYGAVAICSDL